MVENVGTPVGSLRLLHLSRVPGCAQLIAKSLPLDEINGMREIFLEIDKDKSGTISVDEFSDALKRKGVMGLTESDVTRMIAVGGSPYLISGPFGL